MSDEAASPSRRRHDAAAVVGIGPADAVPPRVGEAVRAIAATLRAAGIERPLDEARRLVASVAGLSAITVATEPGQALTPAAVAALADAARRRARREPLSRIVGWREFYGRPFRVSPATLDPRPDTETLIDAVLEIVDSEGGRLHPLSILDVGTGTGCILLTLLAELPHARGLGIDIAPGAVATAADNADRLGLADRARFEVADGPSGVNGPFDLIVSNPPYIPSGDIAGLAPEVRDFDPQAALDGFDDGLGFYRGWIGRLAELAPAGWIVLEVGAGQADAVARMLWRCRRSSDPGGDKAVRRWSDLGGHVRCVAIRPL